MICSRPIVYIFLIATISLFAFSPRSETSAAGNNLSGGTFFSVKDYGASGDGKSLDTAAINKKIDVAAAGGGGTVYFPAGTYLSFSIRLKSNITLYLDNGATLLAADPKEAKGTYDQWEPNEWDMSQYFGHSHWKISLIWGIGFDIVAII